MVTQSAPRVKRTLTWTADRRAHRGRLVMALCDAWPREAQLRFVAATAAAAKDSGEWRR